MKVNLNLNSELHNKKQNKINFEGYKPVKNDFGGLEYEFSYPFDDNRYDCYLEVYRVKSDPNI